MAQHEEPTGYWGSATPLPGPVYAMSTSLLAAITLCHPPHEPHQQLPARFVPRGLPPGLGREGESAKQTRAAPIGAAEYLSVTSIVRGLLSAGEEGSRIGEMHVMEEGSKAW